jgi:hypothetical protein
MKIHLVARNVAGDREVVGIPAERPISDILRLIGLQIENSQLDGRIKLGLDNKVEVWWRLE